MLRAPFVLALALVLAFAGCVGKDEAPAAVDDPVGTASSEEAPASAEAATTATPSAPASSPGANASTTAATAPPPAPAPAPPAPPKPMPWNLTETARLGWAVAAGARVDAVGQAHEQGRSDADRCPDASFALPAGSTSLAVVSERAPAKPGEPEGGVYRVRLTAPDGNATVVEFAPPSGPEMAPARTTVATLLPGPWAVHVEPVGPVVGQVWDITLEAQGASLAAPSALSFVTTC